MFDPTVFDNMKVVIEGAVYDLDLGGSVDITGRSDLIDLALMARTYRISFQLRGKTQVIAELTLHAGTRDLAAEIMEMKQYMPGCQLHITFTVPVRNVELECRRIHRSLTRIWGEETIRQRLSYVVGEEAKPYMNEVTIDFNHPWNEEFLHVVPSMLDRMIQSLWELQSKLDER